MSSCLAFQNYNHLSTVGLIEYDILAWAWLRIDKGSRAMRCVIVRSGGIILSTVNIT